MEAEAQAGREKPVALLHDDYEIICVTTDLTMPGMGGVIYPAKRVGGNETNLIAIVGDRNSCFHLDIADAVEHIKLKSLLTLQSWGICEWPGGGQKVALVYDRPPGPSLSESLAKGKSFSDSEIKKNFLPAMIEVLRAFSLKNLTHGAIRPENIFQRIDNSIVLGDCLSSAPSYYQPAAYLTIERGLALPGGRGVGTAADDIYALGVTLITLAIGELPARISDEQMITRKMEQGSFAYLSGRAKLSTSISNLLRGMLNDNAEERWSVDDIGNWLMGPRAGASAQGDRPQGNPAADDRQGGISRQALDRAGAC